MSDVCACSWGFTKWLKVITANRQMRRRVSGYWPIVSAPQLLYYSSQFTSCLPSTKSRSKWKWPSSSKEVQAVLVVKKKSRAVDGIDKSKPDIGAFSGKSSGERRTVILRYMNRVVVQYAFVCIAIFKFGHFFTRWSRANLIAIPENNLVHLLMLAVPAVGSTKDRAVVSGETQLTNLTASGGGQKLFAVLLIIEITMCAGKQ